MAERILPGSLALSEYTPGDDGWELWDAGASEKIRWSGSAWVVISEGGATMLGGLSDVYLSSPGAGHRLVYSLTAGGPSMPGWTNIPAPDAYDVGFSFPAAPDAGEVLGGHVLVRSVTFDGNFAGSQGFVDVNPTGSSAIIDVQVNGASVGSITITTGGLISFASTSGNPVAPSAGQLITLVAPDPANAALSGIYITLRGSI